MIDNVGVHLNWDQRNHRLQDIIECQNLRDVLISRIDDICVYRVLDTRGLHQVVASMGFLCSIVCQSNKFRSTLITTLMEKWRHETHNFLLSVEELTVTLEDKAWLWGLPVDGAASCECTWPLRLDG